MRWISLSLLVILTACQTINAPSPTEVPFYTATPPTLAQVAPQLADNNVPFLLEAGQPLALSSLGSFEFTVTGLSSQSYTSGTIVYNYIPRIGNQLARDQIFIASSDAQSSQQLAFEFAPTIERGTYLLTASDTVVAGIVTAQYSRLAASSDGSTQLAVYNRNITGTLTLTEVGALISGVFTFRAERELADVSGTPSFEALEIVGRFSEVPYSRLTDPFESPPLEPTQATVESRP